MLAWHYLGVFEASIKYAGLVKPLLPACQSQSLKNLNFEKITPCIRHANS